MDSLNINGRSSRTWIRIVTYFAHGQDIESCYSIYADFLMLLCVLVCVCVCLCLYLPIWFCNILVSNYFHRTDISGSRLPERPMTHLLMRTVNFLLTHIAGPWLHIQGRTCHRRLHNAFKNSRHSSRDGYMGQRGNWLDKSKSLDVEAWNCCNICRFRHCQPIRTTWDISEAGSWNSMMPTCYISSARLDHGLRFQLCFVP